LTHARVAHVAPDDAILRIQPSYNNNNNNNNNNNK
jgi:hypothetical protein